MNMQQRWTMLSTRVRDGLAQDARGRRAVLLTLAATSGFLVIAWAGLWVIEQTIIARLFMSVLGGGQVFLQERPGQTAAPIPLAVWAKAATVAPIAVTCDQPTSVLGPGGRRHDILLRWSTPAVLTKTGQDLRWGRPLGPQDNTAQIVPVILPIELRGWEGGRLQIDGRLVRAVGGTTAPPSWADRGGEGRPVVLAPLALAPPTACPPEGITQLGVIALPPDVDQTLHLVGRVMQEPQFWSRYQRRTGPGTERLWAQLSGLTRVLGGVVSVIVAGLAALTMATMLAVRFESRRFEHALARSLGASLSTLGREVIVESTLLGIAGAGLGVLPTWAAVYLAAQHWGLTLPVAWMALGSAGLGLGMMMGLSVVQVRRLRHQPPVLGLGASE